MSYQEIFDRFHSELFRKTGESWPLRIEVPENLFMRMAMEFRKSVLAWDSKEGDLVSLTLRTSTEYIEIVKGDK